MSEENTAASGGERPAKVVNMADYRDEESRAVRAEGENAKMSPPSLIGSTEFQELCLSLDHRSWGYRAVKRLVDIVFSLLVIVIGFIPGVILSFAIARDTKGSPIYSQVRIGKHGKPFRIYKFRSMVADSDNVEKYFTPDQMEAWKRERKVDDDPRVTKLGGALRRVSFDELPQFVNVFLGQISMIGPRVITLDELSQHFSVEEQAQLLSVTPGITGAWQSGLRNSATFENGKRQAIELDYARHASLKTDVLIFFKTIRVMFVDKTGK